MFASTRHLIHQTLRLTLQNNWSVLTKQEKSRYPRLDHRDELRFVSYMGERGFLQYTRRVHIHMCGLFTPDVLLPHLHHFQTMDQVHTLTIERHRALQWAIDFKTYFAHFYPTITSLTLSHPSGPYQLLLHFALQFPNLENLCLKGVERFTQPNLAIYPNTDRLPPLRGHLRLVGVNTVLEWPTDFVYGLPNGMNFQSVELEDFCGSQARDILNACAHSLEDLTVGPRRTGTARLLFLVSVVT